MKGAVMKKMIGLAVAVAAVVTANAVEGERTVFAHYMTCFYKDVETYKKEILIAQQYGCKVDKKRISLKSDIKNFGTYEAEIRLYAGILAKVTVEVGEA